MNFHIYAIEAIIQSKMNTRFVTMTCLLSQLDADKKHIDDVLDELLYDKYDDEYLYSTTQVDDIYSFAFITKCKQLMPTTVSDYHPQLLNISETILSEPLTKLDTAKRMVEMFIDNISVDAEKHLSVMQSLSIQAFDLILAELNVKDSYTSAFVLASSGQTENLAKRIWSLAKQLQEIFLNHLDAEQELYLTSEEQLVFLDKTCLDLAFS